MLIFNSYKTILLLLIMFSPFSVAELKMPNENSLVIVGYAGECDAYQEYDKQEYLPAEMLSALQDDNYLFQMQEMDRRILFCSLAAKNKFEKLGNKLLGEEFTEFLLIMGVDLFYERTLAQSEISHSESRGLYFKEKNEFGRCINRCFVNDDITSACLSSLTSCSDRDFGKESAYDFFHTNKMENDTLFRDSFYADSHPAIKKLVNYKMTIEFISSDYFFKEIKLGYMPTKNWIGTMRYSLNSKYLFEYYLALFSKAMKNNKNIMYGTYNGIDELYIKLNLAQKYELLSSINAWLFSINQGSWNINKHCTKNNQENSSILRGPHNIQPWMLREKRKLDGHDTVEDDINILKFIENCNLNGRAVRLGMLTDAINRDGGGYKAIYVNFKWSEPDAFGIRSIVRTIPSNKSLIDGRDMLRAK